MTSKLVVFICSFIVWVLFTCKFGWEYWVIGLISSAGIAWFIGDLFTSHPGKFKQSSRYAWFLYYLPVFLWEMVKANFDLAYRIIHPNMPIRPGIVKVKTKLRSDTGLTVLANSISLTPGKTALDFDLENGYIYVHSIYVKLDKNGNDADTERLVQKFDNILLKVFEEF
ncbi:MAG: Na+/H+ antiporter subunit E [Elusimicrobiota bacterium]